MKAKLPQIPNSKSKRKTSPIIGRGAWAAKSQQMNLPPVGGNSELENPAGNLASGSDSFRKNSRKQKSAKDSKTKISKRRSSKPQKVADSENTATLFHTPLNSTDTDPLACLTGASGTVDMFGTSVQPPPKVSPDRRSRKRRSSSLPSLALEESAFNPEATKRPAHQIALPKRAATILAHFQKKLTKHPRILAAAAVLTLLSAGFLFGRLQPVASAGQEERVLAKPGPKLVKDLNDALALIEWGESSKALQKIQALSEKHPDVSSLDYLAALAAMQAGDLKTAQEKASLSITKNQKVSDSLVLLSMTESGVGAVGKFSLRDPKIVRESLLREAVSADVANPFPMIELASFLRSQKRDEEALDLLRAANARLHPIDTHVVVQTSIELMKLQQMADEELPAARAEGSICEIFSSVYISLRRKDYKQAALALEKGRRQASPDLFAYLINDPVFKPFHSEPVLTRAL